MRLNKKVTATAVALALTAGMSLGASAGEIENTNILGRYAEDGNTISSQQIYVPNTSKCSMQYVKFNGKYVLSNASGFRLGGGTSWVDLPGGKYYNTPGGAEVDSFSDKETIYGTGSADGSKLKFTFGGETYKKV